MIEAKNLLTSKGLPNLVSFIPEFEGKFSELRQLLALNKALKATLTRWWDTHKTLIVDWKIFQGIMEVRLSKMKYIKERNMMEKMIPVIT